MCELFLKTAMCRFFKYLFSDTIKDNKVNRKLTD